MESFMYLDKLKSRFAQLNIASPNGVKPCTEEEVHILEQALRIDLPYAYREFLLWMGHGAGDFWRGSQCWYKHLPRLRQAAIELLTENQSPLYLPEDGFVFFMHQGYQFDFFKLAEGQDPPVYFYGEWTDQLSFTLTHPAFSEFLSEQIEAHAPM